MAATMVLNGKPRKQLADQLDRLDAQMERQDSILDALSDGLNGAVQDAAKQGVREAVTEAVITMLSDPALRSALHQATADAKPIFWQRLKEKVQRTKLKVADAATKAIRLVKSKVAEVKSVSSELAGPARIVWRLRKLLFVGLGVGVLVAGLSYVTSHSFATAVSGIGAASTVMALQGAGWLRKVVRRLAIG